MKNNDFLGEPQGASIMKNLNVCIVIKGRTREACAAISRSYSPKTLEIMQAIEAKTYNPKNVKGAVFFGGASRKTLSSRYIRGLQSEGFEISEVSDRFLCKKSRDVLKLF